MDSPQGTTGRPGTHVGVVDVAAGQVQAQLGRLGLVAAVGGSRGAGQAGLGCFCQAVTHTGDRSMFCSIGGGWT